MSAPTEVCRRHCNKRVERFSYLTIFLMLFIEPKSWRHLCIHYIYTVYLCYHLWHPPAKFLYLADPMRKRQLMCTSRAARRFILSAFFFGLLNRVSLHLVVIHLRTSFVLTSITAVNKFINAITINTTNNC